MNDRVTRNRCRRRAGDRLSSRLALAAAVAGVLAAALTGAGCAAQSRVGTAEVSTSGGLPCFAIPIERETRSAPVRLQSLSVTQGPRADWRSLAPEVWGFDFDARGTLVDASRAGCMRYGEAPASATPHGDALPLLPGRLYRVEINARPSDGRSPTLGYEAEFCLKPGLNGQAPAVQAVPWDATARRWRRDVCDSP